MAELLVTHHAKGKNSTCSGRTFKSSAETSPFHSASLLFNPFNAFSHLECNHKDIDNRL